MDVGFDIKEALYVLARFREDAQELVPNLPMPGLDATINEFSLQEETGHGPKDWATLIGNRGF